MISTRFHVQPFNMAVYASTTDAEEEIDMLYSQVQYAIERMCQEDALLVAGHWNVNIRNTEENMA